VNIAEEDLNTFLEVAEDLKVKGMFEENKNGLDTRLPKIMHQNIPEPKPSIIFETLTKNVLNIQSKPDSTSAVKIKPILVNNSSVFENDNRRVENCEDLIIAEYDKKVIKPEEKGNNYKNLEHQKRGNQNSCSECDKHYTDRGNLRRHIRSVHQQVRHTCIQCSASFNDLSNLKRHKESQHEGVRYACDHCDYKATERSSLMRHTERHHNI